MDNSFTVTLSGKSGRFSTLIEDGIDFASHPCEVCVQDVVFEPGAWCNIRKHGNWFVVHRKRKTFPPPKGYIKWVDDSTMLFLEEKSYELSELLYTINKMVMEHYHNYVDLFYYANRFDPNVESVFPQPASVKDRKLFETQIKQTRRFRMPDHASKAPVIETPGMEKPLILSYGGGTDQIIEKRGSDDSLVKILFCPEISILLGIIPDLNVPPPMIMRGWSVQLNEVNVHKNNLKMLWIYGDFCVTTMIGPTRDQLLRIVPVLMDPPAVQFSSYYGQDYVAVQRRRMTNLEVWIKETPEISDVLPLNGEIVIVLLFRPKQ